MLKIKLTRHTLCFSLEARGTVSGRSVWGQPTQLFSCCWPPFDFQQWQLWGDAQLIYTFTSLPPFSPSEKSFSPASHLLKPQRHHLLRAASFCCWFFLLGPCYISHGRWSSSKIYLTAQVPTRTEHYLCFKGCHNDLATQQNLSLCWPISPLLIEPAIVVMSWEMLQF